MLKRSKSHYSISLAFPKDYHDLKASREARKAAQELRKEQRNTLKSLGFTEKYYQFTDGDAAGKARAKAQAELQAKLWTEKTGFKFDVSEGFFMGF